MMCDTVIDMKNRQLIFIDDSGDPGLKNGASSSVFVLAGVVFESSEIATSVNKEISNYRKALGWEDRHEFKFRKAPKKIKMRFLEIVDKYHFEIYAVFVDKARHLNTPRPFDKEKLYNLAIKELLFSMPLSGAQVKIDGKYDKKYKLRMKAYVRRIVNKDTSKISNFDSQDSVRDNLIQLADMVAGSINRYIQTGKTDSEDYIKIIRDKVVQIKQLNF